MPNTRREGAAIMTNAQFSAFVASVLEILRAYKVRRIVIKAVERIAETLVK